MRPPSLALRVALLAAIGLAGCASMTEDQCRRADWFERGRRDGGQGEPSTYIDAHRQACAKAGVLPDGTRWLAGWQDGVRGYCTPRSAWDSGAANRSYQGACRDLDEAAWLRWYRSGQDLYRTRRERDTARSEIDKLERQLKKAEKDDERKQLREQIHKLDVEHARLRRLAQTLESAAPR